MTFWLRRVDILLIQVLVSFINQRRRLIPASSLLHLHCTRIHIASVLLSALGIKSQCIVTELAHAVHSADNAFRAAPVAAIESFQEVDPQTPLAKATWGLFGHQFIIATIRVKTAEHPDGMLTYIRADFREKQFGGHFVWQEAKLSDDHEELRAGARGLGRLAVGQGGLALKGQPAHTGRSLDSLATLLEIIHSRTGHYDLYGHNCLWFTENLLLSTGRKYAEHWLAGYIWPDALRIFVAGEGDVVACATALSIPNPAARWLGATSTRVLRATQAFFTNLKPAPDRLEVHDEEIRQNLEAWRLEVQAAA